MSVHRQESELPRDAAGRPNGKLIDVSRGATQGFCLGISYYDGTEYPPLAAHDDQEAIYILEGTGTAKVGGEEFPVRAGTAFYVGKGVPHAVKRDAASGSVKGLWTHGALRE